MHVGYMRSTLPNRFGCIFLLRKLCVPTAQVVPACVVDSGNPDKGSDDMETDATPVQVIQRGVISHWEGLEALLYNILFRQVCNSLGGSQNVSCSLKVHAELALEGLSKMCADLQLGWMEDEEGLLVVSEPLFFPRVSHSFAMRHCIIPQSHNLLLSMPNFRLTM